MACRRCIERGKTWTGTDPTCQFTDAGEFTPEGWMCATMSELRTLAGMAPSNELEMDNAPESEPSIYGFSVRSGDSSIATIEAPNEHNVSDWIVLSWYKDRGRVSAARVFNDDDVSELTLKVAERALDYGKDYAAAHQYYRNPIVISQ